MSKTFYPLKDQSEPGTRKDPSKDKIASKNPPATDSRLIGEQLPPELLITLL